MPVKRFPIRREDYRAAKDLAHLFHEMRSAIAEVGKPRQPEEFDLVHLSHIAPPPEGTTPQPWLRWLHS